MPEVDETMPGLANGQSSLTTVVEQDEEVPQAATDVTPDHNPSPTSGLTLDNPMFDDNDSSWEVTPGHESILRRELQAVVDPNDAIESHDVSSHSLPVQVQHSWISLQQKLPGTNTTMYSKTDVWDANFNKVLEFKEKTGHLQIPFKEEYHRLALWFKNQKTREIMPAYQKEKLETLHYFDLVQTSGKEKEETNWNRMFQRLRHHKEQKYLKVWRISDPRFLSPVGMLLDPISKLNW
jgi:hypothetical protein